MCSTSKPAWQDCGWGPLGTAPGHTYMDSVGIALETAHANREFLAKNAYITLTENERDQWLGIICDIIDMA